MTGFFLKKAFFDSWDNLIALVFLNLGYLLVLLTLYSALELLTVSAFAGVAVMVVALALHSAFGGAVSVQTKEYADYNRPPFSHFLGAFKLMWRHSLVHFIITLLLVVMVLFVIPFYLAYASLVGFIIAVFVLWVVLATSMALMYYYPLAIHMPHDRPLKTLKKSYLILADNLGFSLLFGFHHLVNLALTILFATIMPGMAGIHLSRQVAVKLLMMKYDYLEEHPDVSRREIPWEELLFEERERVGKRTLRGMIFPWKE